jgi:hypothetical protein
MTLPPTATHGEAVGDVVIDGRAPPSDKSDRRFRKTAIEYDKKSGIKWVRCSVK